MPDKRMLSFAHIEKAIEEVEVSVDSAQDLSDGQKVVVRKFLGGVKTVLQAGCVFPNPDGPPSKAARYMPYPAPPPPPYKK
ncbi:MAG: hypothetical protein DMF82_15295 [Acidobacteria bacterium]|nr:MAG: hypothetical protein DMF82_15295 [Acidobacteriota bacterium]